MQPMGWRPKFVKSRFSENYQKPSNFRSINTKDRTHSANEDTFFKRRQKPHVLAGMFANAKSSVPSGTSSQINVLCSFSNDHPSLSRAYSTSPRKLSKFSNFPRANLSKTWDFSDISSIKDQTPPPPLIKRSSSEEEKELPEKKAIQSPSTSATQTIVLPWLKKWNSEDEVMSKKPRNVDNLDLPTGFGITIDRFSARLDRINAIPPIPLQNHTDTTIGTVEKALVAAALAQTKTVKLQKTLPVFDLLVERSDWLMYREEYNDETDYPPKDPFFSHDVVSSDFEEYEQQKEGEHDPSYSQMLNSGNDDDEGKKDNSKNGLDFLNESLIQDSQEDFFDQSSTTNSLKTAKYTQSPNIEYPLFTDYCVNSNATDRYEIRTKFTSESASSRVPRISRKRHLPENPFENCPGTSTSSGYSPFNYSIFSPSSAPSKPKTSSSKYSFW